MPHRKPLIFAVWIFNMRSSPFWLIVIGLMLVLDFYVFQALKLVTQGAAARIRSIVFITYWALSVLALITFVLLPFLNLDSYSKTLRSTIFAVVAGLFFAKFAVFRKTGFGTPVFNT